MKGILKRLEALSWAGGGENHDLINVVEGAAWVLDGATPLGEDAAAGDAVIRGFVSLVDERLRCAVREPLELREVLRRVIEEVVAAAGDGEQGEPWSMPSCAVGIVRLREGFLDYLVLGDITIAVAVDGGEVRVVNDNRITQLDEAVVREIAFLMKRDGLSFGEAREKVVPILRRHRALMNTPEGYWILSGDPAAAEYALVGTVPPGRRVRCLLASDGFARVVTTFKFWADWEGLFDNLRRRSLRDFFSQLRSFEDSDSGCCGFPRLKARDDASAIYMEWEFV